MTVEFVELPVIARKGGPRNLDPQVVSFLEELQDNPGKWAVWPVQRKTKPEVPEGFKVSRRNSINYASFQGVELVEDLVG